MAAAILALAVAAIAQALVAGQQQVAYALHEQRAIMLAEALVEEILSYPYADPQGDVGMGPDSGESGRGSFDNVDDFNGYQDVAGSLQDAAGEAYPDTFQVFSRLVAVSSSNMSLSVFSALQPGVVVSVKVTDDAGRFWIVKRFVPEPGA